jgi:beta-glucosidase
MPGQVDTGAEERDMESTNGDTVRSGSGRAESGQEPYRDSRRPIEERVADLLGRMTVEEKVGAMFHPPIGMNPDGTLDEEGHFGATTELVSQHLLTHFNVFSIAPPRQMAEWHNRLQELAASTRLGIPITISSDPRHSFSNNPAANLFAGAFSKWPEPIGLAATGDPELVRRFADIARREYLAVGIRTALHPMADLATEPRWARINGTFGEDADLAAWMVNAYIRGFQGEQFGPQSVACMTKHFPGGGPQKDGEDPHFPYGREQIYPGDNFDYHLMPFEAAFAAGTAQIMPYYGMPVGLPLEEVGFGFNRDVIGGLLRERYGFDGVVCTDWGLITDSHFGGGTMVARAWGVEHLSPEDRLVKALDAGVDQFGGERCTELLIDLVHQGRIPESRLDASVRRLLRDKFRLGLFDNPFVDVDAAERIVGSAEFCEAGAAAQRRSIVLLRNAGAAGRRTLPVAGRPRVYLEGIDASTVGGYTEIATELRDADLAILRISTPYEPRNDSMLESFFHAGSLAFPPDELQRILHVLETVPTIVVIHLDRPAVIPEIAAESAALLGEFGASDEAVLDIIFGRSMPEGRLPFELPSSMEAVQRQRPDVPRDSGDPLFPFAHGLTY